MERPADKSASRFPESIRRQLVTRPIATPVDARELAYELLAEEARLMCRASRAYRALARRGPNRVELSFERPGEWVSLGLYVRGFESELEMSLNLGIAKRGQELVISGSAGQPEGDRRWLPEAVISGGNAARVVVAMCDELLPGLWEAIDAASAWSSAIDSRSDVEAAIRHAFAGVRLGHGVSLAIARLIDRWADPALIDPLFGTEPERDWQSIPKSELDRADCIAHFDAEGLRYYLPALMLKLLDDYDPGEMWCIGTIMALDQRRGHPLGFLDLLTQAQREAVAQFVKVVPHLVALDREDATVLMRAYRDIWSKELGEPQRGS